MARTKISLHDWLAYLIIFTGLIFGLYGLSNLYSNAVNSPLYRNPEVTNGLTGYASSIASITEALSVEIVGVLLMLIGILLKAIFTLHRMERHMTNQELHRLERHARSKKRK